MLLKAAAVVDVVGAGRFDRSALAGEFRNIGARDERLAAGAGEHDDAHLVVGGEFGESACGRLPHLERHRVVPLGIVEGDDADARLLAREQLVGLSHGQSFCSCVMRGHSRSKNGVASLAYDPRIPLSLLLVQRSGLPVCIPERRCFASCARQ